MRCVQDLPCLQKTCQSRFVMYIYEKVIAAQQLTPLSVFPFILPRQMLNVLFFLMLGSNTSCCALPVTLFGSTLGLPTHLSRFSIFLTILILISCSEMLLRAIMRKNTLFRHSPILLSVSVPGHFVLSSPLSATWSKVRVFNRTSVYLDCQHVESKIHPLDRSNVCKFYQIYGNPTILHARNNSDYLFPIYSMIFDFRSTW